MSAAIETARREDGIVWLTYVGRGDSLREMLDKYGIEWTNWLLQERNGSIGILFRESMPEFMFTEFCRASRLVVEELSSRVPKTSVQSQAAFSAALSVLQMGQAKVLNRKVS